MKRKNLIRKMFFKEKLSVGLFYVVLLLFWQLLYWIGTSQLRWWKSYAFPSPLGVVESCVNLIENGTLFRAFLYSAIRGVIGFGIAIIIGLAVGILLSLSEKIHRCLHPLLLGLQTLPSICWVPFAILWFGLDESAVLFVVVMGSAFSIALSVRNGIRNVNPLWIKAAKTMGADRKQLYIKVMLPASMPAFVEGLRQGWSFAWRALMSGEVMSATVGLGHTLMMGRDLADINQVMLVMLVIILIGIIIDRFVFWRIEERILRKRGLK